MKYYSYLDKIKAFFGQIEKKPVTMDAISAIMEKYSIPQTSCGAWNLNLKGDWCTPDCNLSVWFLHGEIVIAADGFMFSADHTVSSVEEADAILHRIVNKLAIHYYYKGWQSVIDFNI